MRTQEICGGLQAIFSITVSGTIAAKMAAKPPAMAARKAATAMETAIIWRQAAFLAGRLATNLRIQNTKIKYCDKIY